MAALRLVRHVRRIDEPSVHHSAGRHSATSKMSGARTLSLTCTSRDRQSCRTPLWWVPRMTSSLVTASCPASGPVVRVRDPARGRAGRPAAAGHRHGRDYEPGDPATWPARRHPLEWSSGMSEVCHDCHALADGGSTLTSIFHDFTRICGAIGLQLSPWLQGWNGQEMSE